MFIKEILDILKSLDSIYYDNHNAVHGNSHPAFYFSPNLKEILEISGTESSKLEKEEIEQLKSFLQTKENQVSKFLNNPNEFYKNQKEVDDLYQFVENIQSVYTQEFHVISTTPSFA